MVNYVKCKGMGIQSRWPRALNDVGPYNKTSYVLILRLCQGMVKNSLPNGCLQPVTTLVSMSLFRAKFCSAFMYVNGSLYNEGLGGL